MAFAKDLIDPQYRREGSIDEKLTEHTGDVGRGISLQVIQELARFTNRFGGARMLKYGLRQYRGCKAGYTTSIHVPEVQSLMTIRSC